MIPLAVARRYLEQVRADLAPQCERFEVAGSVRRGRPEVNDLELVVIPKRAPVDLFGGELEACAGFVRAVARWRKIRGDATGRYTRRIIEPGVELDLFIARPENFGLIFAIRTGSAAWAYNVLACAWVAAGYNSEDGMLRRRKDGAAVEVREEIELFGLCGLPWTDPQHRELR